MLTCKYNMLSFILAKEIDFPQYFKDPSTLWGSITMYSLGSGKTATACLYSTSHLPFCLVGLLFHKNVAKMSPHWKPSLAPKIRLVALLYVHIEPSAFPT